MAINIKSIVFQYVNGNYLVDNELFRRNVLLLSSLRKIKLHKKMRICMELRKM
jgi:hypothetical protein